MAGTEAGKVPPPDDDLFPAHVEDDDDRELTEEEKDMVAVRCLRFFNVLLMLVGGGLTGLALWGGRVAIEGLGAGLAYVVAGVGASICFMTLFGLAGAMSRWNTLLVVYYTWLVILAFGMLVLGGLSFVFTDSATAYLRNNWVAISSALPASQRTAAARDTLLNNVRFALWGVGLLCLLLLSMILGAVSSVARLVTPIRAYTLLLQANNVTLLPVGVALIGIATYVADTAIGVEGPVMAYAIFILGVFVITLTMLGCTGATLRSRGLLRMFMGVTALLSLAFLTFGVASLAVSARVTTFIVAQWTSIRRVLPAGFSGKYDKDQFASFVGTNLAALGFFALCTFVLLGTQSWGSFRLRGEIREEAELIKEAGEAAEAGIISKEDAAALADMRSSTGPLEVCWKRSWTNGSRASRCCVILLFLLSFMVLLVVVAVATAALYYTTSCTNLDLYSEAKAYDSVSDAGPYVVAVSNVSRGALKLHVITSPASVATGIALAMRKSAYSADMAVAGWPGVSQVTRTRPLDVLGSDARSSTYAPDAPSYTYTANSITAVEKAPTRVVGVDTSCQSTDITFSLPRAGLLGGNTRAAGDARPLAFDLLAGGLLNGVEADWSGVERTDRPRLRRLDVYAAGGPIDLSGLLIGSKGMSVRGDNGTVSLEGLDVQCDPQDAGIAPGLGGADVSTKTGAIAVSGSTFTDCDVTLSGSAGTTTVSSTIVRSSLGGSRLSLSSVKGGVEVSTSRLEVLEVKGEDGTVRLSNITVSTGVKVATGSGPIYLDALRMGSRGSIQVESETGDITIYAAQFSGIVTVATGGAVSCSTAGRSGFMESNPCGGAAVSTEKASDDTTITVLERVNVNCAPSVCAYMGSLAVTSARGDVSLRFDRWTAA